MLKSSFPNSAAWREKVWHLTLTNVGPAFLILQHGVRKGGPLTHNSAAWLKFWTSTPDSAAWREKGCHLTLTNVEV